MIQFPEKFQERMQQMLGDEEYAEFLKSYDLPFHNGLRINTWKIKPQELLQRMGVDLKQVPWNETGFYLENKKQFSKHPYYQGGLYYIQEASAMLPAKLVNAQPGEKILDMCAAPGGKSTAIGAALKGEGLLISNDISKSRAKALLRNLEGFGIINSIVVSEYPEKLSRYFPEFFDKVLIDAPCSGEGMFHKEPSMTESWLRMGPEEYHKLQMEILTYGAKMVRPGGKLIYSTCTFSPEEDEGSIAWFLREHPDFHLVEVNDDEDLCGCHCIDHGHPEWADGNTELTKTRRLWPHHLEGEGHFAAVLCRDADSEPMGGKVTLASVPKLPAEIESFFQFLETEGIHYSFDKKRLLVQNGYVQYIPEGMPELKGLHIMRSGWFLGELKKKRFEPSGAFARGLTPDVCDKVIAYPGDSEEVVRYLKCETLQVNPNLKNGWYLICVDEFALGWGKVSYGTLKNKYPSGWRLV